MELYNKLGFVVTSLPLLPPDVCTLHYFCLYLLGKNLLKVRKITERYSNVILLTLNSFLPAKLSLIVTFVIVTDNIH